MKLCKYLEMNDKNSAEYFFINAIIRTTYYVVTVGCKKNRPPYFFIVLFISKIWLQLDGSADQIVAPTKNSSRLRIVDTLAVILRYSLYLYLNWFQNDNYLSPRMTFFIIFMYWKWYSRESTYCHFGTSYGRTLSYTSNWPP